MQLNNQGGEKILNYATLIESALPISDDSFVNQDHFIKLAIQPKMHTYMTRR